MFLDCSQYGLKLRRNAIKSTTIKCKTVDRRLNAVGILPGERLTTNPYLEVAAMAVFACHEGGPDSILGQCPNPVALGRSPSALPTTEEFPASNTILAKMQLIDR